MLTTLFIALSTLVSEDLTCIAAGVLISQRKLSLIQGLTGCTLGIFLGDLLLVFAGRYAALLRIKTPPVLDVLNRRTARVLVWTRFTPGLRLPAYLGAGFLRLPMRRVVPPLAAGSMLWTPLLVGAAALFGAALVTNVIKALELCVAGALAWHLLRSYERRRRILAFFHRLLRWEFWPSWAVYLPLIPYLLWLGVRHRSLTLFTAANPGIPAGGLMGESKSAILAELAAAPEFAARYETVVARDGAAGRARAFMERNGLTFPLVLKPDVGERGTGVAIVRSEQQIREYFDKASGVVIAQEFVPGEEFGIFYQRMPGQSHGRVTSITHKRLPFVVGDGHSTLSRLILADRRAFILHEAYARALRRSLSDVPEPGERVRLVEIGSHCRGAIFVDATARNTPELECAVDRVCKAHPGFYFGRFDVRAESVEALRAGRFTVLELNGVGAESTHVYDPAVSLISAYSTIFRQWKAAYETGAANRRNGAAPASVMEILRTWRELHARASTGH